MKDLTYIASGPDTGGWKGRHRIASISSHPIACGIQAWCEYAKVHEARSGSPIGEDYFLGPAWEQWGRALRTLLNGELGGLDAGTLDTIIHRNLTEQGYEE